MNSGGFNGEVSSKIFLSFKNITFLRVKVKTKVKCSSMATIGILKKHLPRSNNSKSVENICEQIAISN